MLTFALTLLAVAPTPKSTLAPQVPTTAADERAVRAYFDNQLFDGISARIKLWPLKRSNLICGTINAKNQLGAYVGWTPFYFFNKPGDPDGEIVAEGDDAGAVMLSALCPQLAKPVRD